MSLKKQTQILQPVLLYLRGPSMFSILRVYHPHYPLCCSHTGCLPVLDVLVKSNSGPLCSLLPLPESVTASAMVPGMCFLILLPPGSPALMLGADIQDEAQLHPHPSTQRPPPAAPVQAAKSPRSPQSGSWSVISASATLRVSNALFSLLQSLLHKLIE